MAYIGNQVTSVPFTIDLFSGDGSTTFFGPLVRSPATVASVAVHVNGLYKTPGVDYTVNSNYISFTVAPAVGTNNIANAGTITGTTITATTGIFGGTY